MRDHQILTRFYAGLKWRVTLSPSEVYQLWSSADLSSIIQLFCPLFSVIHHLPVNQMELLKSLKIDVDGPPSETLGNLTSLSLDTSLTLREELF